MIHRGEREERGECNKRKVRELRCLIVVQYSYEWMVYGAEHFRVSDRIKWEVEGINLPRDIDVTFPNYSICYSFPFNSTS